MACFDWSDKLSEEKNWQDHIKVSIFTDEILEFDIYENIISSESKLYELMDKYSFDGYLKVIFAHLNDLNTSSA